MESLPESLAEGVSIVAFTEEPDGTLTARIDLVRRAWNLDIIVSARITDVALVDPMLSSMLELLTAVKPNDTPGEAQ